MGNHPKTKKAITVSFLFIVNAFILWNLSMTLPAIEITFPDGTMTFENKALAAPAKEEVKAKELTIEEKIAKVFPENPKVMIAVAKAESGLNPLTVHKNTDGSRDLGIMQINSVHGEDDLKMLDVDQNLAVARKVYEKQGITAWAAFNNGSYKKFL